MVATTTLREQINKELDKMSEEQLRRVLLYTQIFGRPLPQGTPGPVLLKHMDSFHFEPGDLDEMAQAIEEGCETIDWESWR